MVKLIVLDVDGVIVGHKAGVNFPYPNQKVISALKKVKQQGIPVVLCTGKIYHAVELIVQKAHLSNPHIANAGALIFDPKTKKFESFNIDKNLVLNIITTCSQNKLYLEVYFENDYFIQKDAVNEITVRRTHILQKNPKIVKSLIEEVKKQKVAKITVLAMDEQDRKRIEKLLEQYQNQATFTWTINPSTNPWEYCMITSKEVSKAHAVKEVANSLGISLKNALGIGDTLGDWGFMKLCSYVATMEDGAPELKRLVESKGEGKYMIAPSVNDDGILSILDYFLRDVLL